MNKTILKISDDFWNIRGEFKIGGIINIGTHSSLVRCHNGKFVLLDAYTYEGEVKQHIDNLTNNGADIEAIINLHPFHTIHVESAHQLYPEARLYGTRRHIDKFPDLPWQPELTESEECAAIFAEDFEFSIPAGVDFIASNEHLHFSSVLAYHKKSKTIHSDDTLMYVQLPWPMGKVVKPEVTFHMTLPQTLQKRAGAANEFRQWAAGLAEQWGDAVNLCAAHSATLVGCGTSSASMSDRIMTALRKVGKTLQRHEKKFG